MHKIEVKKIAGSHKLQQKLLYRPILRSSQSIRTGTMTPSSPSVSPLIRDAVVHVQPNAQWQDVVIQGKHRRRRLAPSQERRRPMLVCKPTKIARAITGGATSALSPRPKRRVLFPSLGGRRSLGAVGAPPPPAPTQAAALTSAPMMAAPATL